jgi:hypothetical protein
MNFRSAANPIAEHGCAQGPASRTEIVDFLIFDGEWLIEKPRLRQLGFNQQSTIHYLGPPW